MTGSKLDMVASALERHRILWIRRQAAFAHTQRRKPAVKTFYGNTSRLWLLVAEAMLIALVTIGTGANSADAKNMVPFEGSYSGAVQFTGPTTALFTGTGISSHLGRGANEGNIMITGTIADPNTGCVGGIVNTNVEKLTASNGDSLTLTSYDVGCPTSPGLYHGTGTWTVTGGTGRFSGATGQGTLDGYSDLNQSEFSFQLTGVISAPNGK
jgi:hypothetical protein